MITPGGRSSIRHSPLLRESPMRASSVPSWAWYTPPGCSCPTRLARIRYVAWSWVRDSGSTSIFSTMVVLAPSSHP